MSNNDLQKKIREAITNGNEELAIALFNDNRAACRIVTPFGSWLHVAASEGKLGVVQYLVENGLDINACAGIEDSGPLHQAAGDGHVNVANYLISCGAKLDTSKSDRNPLFAAIYGGHTDVAKLLIDSGIDTSIKYTGQNMKNMDALAFAKEWGRDEIVALLEPLQGKTASVPAKKHANSAPTPKPKAKKR